MLAQRRPAGRIATWRYALVALAMAAVPAAASPLEARAVAPMAAALAEPATVPVDIKLFTYEPSFLQVGVGTTVLWTNQDAVEHSVTHGAPALPGGTFDSGLLTEGESFSLTFEAPGRYDYFCLRHPSMVGAIEVVAP